jgi:CHAT domain-containing protein
VKANIHEGQVLYFGTHAIADPTDPLRSKLVLAKEVGEQREDGYLHAYELFGLPLQAELAVLNACESGVGNLQKGEGMISLAYSMHYAGCPSTVLSLWKVDEKINTGITAQFLDYLQQGVSSSEALRQAKLDYLNSADARGQHPFYWGGMVLLGKDNPVALAAQPRRAWALLGVAGVLALLVYGGYRYRRGFLR